MQVWKEFDDNEVTHSMAHYLMAIQELLKRQGYARVTDVARELEITPGSASVSIRALKAKGYVSEDHNRFLGLTDEGEKIAHDVHMAHKSFQVFMMDVLGVSAEQANIDSCKIEHLVSSETREKMMVFLQFVRGDNQAAKEFMKAFRSFDFTCPGAGKCELCEDNHCELECLHEHSDHVAEG